MSSHMSPATQAIYALIVRKDRVFKTVLRNFRTRAEERKKKNILYILQCRVAAVSSLYNSFFIMLDSSAISRYLLGGLSYTFTNFDTI